MGTTTLPNGLAAAPPGAALLGEVITWSCGGVRVRHLDLVHALRDAGLDESVARELAPRHAFTRACKRLQQARIIRQVAEDDTHLQFQFTAEHKDGDRYSYDFETLLTLEKARGLVTCDLPGLATLAQEELDRCIASRTGADVTRVVQKLFERRADLFPIRPAGGAYFVPREHAAFVEKVQGFLGAINGQLLRFPVPAGTREGDRSVREAVASGLATLIEEHRQAVEGFGTDTRADTLERAAEKIRRTRFKVEGYAAYLAEEKDRLERELDAASRRLWQKVEQITAGRDGVAADPGVPSPR